jgi:hypothetical protein
MKDKKEENGVKREMTNDKRTTKVTTRNENKKMAETKKRNVTELKMKLDDAQINKNNPPPLSSPVGHILWLR